MVYQVFVPAVWGLWQGFSGRKVKVPAIPWGWGEVVVGGGWGCGYKWLVHKAASYILALKCLFAFKYLLCYVNMVHLINVLKSIIHKIRCRMCRKYMVGINNIWYKVLLKETFNSSDKNSHKLLNLYQNYLHTVMILSFWTNRPGQTVDPDQTAPRAVWSGSTLFAIPSASFALITLR